MNHDIWLKRVAKAGAIATIVIGLLEIVRVLTGLVIIPEGVSPVQYMEPWQTVVVILLGLALLGWLVAPRSTAVKAFALFVGSGTLVLALLSLMTHVWPSAVSIPILHKTRPLGGYTILMAAVALLLTAPGRATAANIVGLLITSLAAIMLLGIMYGGELFINRDSPQVSVAAALAALCFGVGVVAANGPYAWPTRKFVGEDVPAVLVRWFLPFVVLSVLLTDALTIYLFADISLALGSALNTIVSMALAGLVISNVGRIIGGRLERSHSALRESEEKFRRLFAESVAEMNARREAERQYRQLVEGVRDVVFSLTPDRKITTLNPAFTKITGFDAADWIGKPFSDLIHPDDRARALQELNASLAGYPIPGPPVRIRTSTGYIDGDIHTAPHVEDGEIISILGIGRDISERVALEEQLRQSQKMEAVGRLAGGIAHDFNNLLTVIISSGEVALSTLEKSCEERGDIEEMVTAGQRAAEMTRQLLAFSRRQVLNPRDVDLNVILAQMKRMLRRLIGEDISLVTNEEPDLGIINADPGQLEQVIVNLAVNSRDAMKHGGTLTLTTSNEVVDRKSVSRHKNAREGPYVRLRVSDTGTGITPSDIRHIFEPFFTTKPTGEGTGLGLSTVLGIVEQSGGFISVSSETGQGTIFDIYLPRVADHVEQTIMEQRPEVRRGDETVLVVEDNPAVRALTARILKSLGYTVLEAGSGSEALSIATGYVDEIDLVVSDVVMPQMSGPVMVDAMLKIRPRIKVLFVSGYPDEVVDRHGVLGDGFSLLSKPFTPAELGIKVREVLIG